VGSWVGASMVVSQPCFGGDLCARKGWVFITGENSEKKKLWYLQKADFFQHEISYTVYWPDLMVYRIGVGAASSVEPVSKRSGTTSTVTYDFVGTSAEGNREVERRTSRPKHFVEDMEHWRRQIQAYLEASDR